MSDDSPLIETVSTLASEFPPTTPERVMVTNEIAFLQGKALLRYSDAIFYSVDEPIEGGRLNTAVLLLSKSVEQLTSALPPSVPSIVENEFWKSHCQSAGLSASTFSALFDEQQRGSLTTNDFKSIRKTVWNAVAELDLPQRKQVQKQVMRTAKWLTLVFLTFAAAFGGVQLFRYLSTKPNLLTGKAFRTSSTLGRDFGNSKILFHTDEEASPWVEYDFGENTLVKQLILKNRSDCCDERAIPLVVEVSDDQTNWRAVANWNERFGRLVLPLADVQTRYLRIRVTRPSFLHFESVEAN